jgi:hypothetical protein
MLDRFRILLAFPLLCAAGCGLRVAGTSTSTENTIASNYLGGTITLPDGSAAAGAVVSVRSAIVVLTRSHVPTARLLAQTTADSTGTFTAPLPCDQVFFLEIRSGDSVSWYKEYPRITQSTLGLGKLTLEPTVEVKGTLRPDSGHWNTRAWIGIAGTDLFRPLAPTADSAGAAFSLPAAPAGAHALVVYDEPMIQAEQTDVPIPVDSIGYSGTGPTRDVGQIRFHPGD